MCVDLNQKLRCFICLFVCLLACLQKTEHEAQKLRSENYLIGVRLTSMSEILALQEADITKVGVV